MRESTRIRAAVITTSIGWARLVVDRLRVAGPADHYPEDRSDRAGLAQARRYRCREEDLVATEHCPSKGLDPDQCPSWDLHLDLVLS